MTIYYDPEFGLKVPKRTEFYKIDKNGELKKLETSFQETDSQPDIIEDPKKRPHNPHNLPSSLQEGLRCPLNFGPLNILPEKYPCKKTARSPQLLLPRKT